MCWHDSNSESVPLDKDIFGYFHWAAATLAGHSLFFSGLLDNGGVSHSPVRVFLQLPLDISASGSYYGLFHRVD